MSKQFVHWKTESDPFVLNLDSGFKPLRGHYVELEYKTFEFKGGDDVMDCSFVSVFWNGKLMKDWTLSEIRERVSKSF